MKKQTINIDEDQPVLNHEQEQIRSWLKKVRFKPAVVGGVSEADVWKKIGELNAMYESALSAERARYDALLKDRMNMVAKQAAKQAYEKALAQLRQERGDETSF